MSKIFNEFKDRYLGKTVDVDGAFGGQCVDLFNAWNRDYNGVYINCSPSGYAKSLAENKENNGILNYFKETTVDNMIEGTVVVYGNCKFSKTSHVCFFIEDNGDGTYKALQQNYGYQEWVTINNNPYEGIIGAFIPNQILEERNHEPVVVPSSDEALNLAIELLAVATISGVYGNGEERKAKLGILYEPVQSLVNDILLNG